MILELKWDDPNATFLRVQQMLRDRGEAIARVPDRAIRRGTFELLALVQQRVPKKTTALVKSLQAVVQKISADLLEGKVGSHLHYAKYVERGTGVHGPSGKPFSIVARHKKALFWGAYDGGGKPIFRRRAVVQGMKPRAPFRLALAQFLPRYLEIIQQELAKEGAR
jgi:hypothetical protein